MRSLRIVVLAAAVLTAACGGGDDDDGAVASSTTAAVDDAAVTSALRGQLLALEDLATDDPLDTPWVAGDVQEGVDIELPGCVVEEPLADALGGVEGKFVTQSDLKLPSLEEDLARYEDADGAAAAFDAAVARLDGCTPVFVFQGTPSDGSIERLALTLPGEQSAAWRTTVTIAGAVVSVTTIHVQQGDLELVLVHTDLATPDPAALEGYAAKAAARLT